jgi:hypothetical protein
LQSVARPPTFLPLVEDGRAGMVDAHLVLVLVRFAAALVHTLLGHVDVQVTEWW